MKRFYKTEITLYELKANFQPDAISSFTVYCVENNLRTFVVKSDFSWCVPTVFF